MRVCECVRESWGIDKAYLFGFLVQHALNYVYTHTHSNTGTDTDTDTGVRCVIFQRYMLGHRRTAHNLKPRYGCAIKSSTVLLSLSLSLWLFVPVSHSLAESLSCFLSLCPAWSPLHQLEISFRWGYKSSLGSLLKL